MSSYENAYLHEKWEWILRAITLMNKSNSNEKVCNSNETVLYIYYNITWNGVVYYKKIQKKSLTPKKILQKNSKKKSFFGLNFLGGITLMKRCGIYIQDHMRMILTWEMRMNLNYTIRFESQYRFIRVIPSKKKNWAFFLIFFFSGVTSLFQ